MPKDVFDHYIPQLQLHMIGLALRLIEDLDQLRHVGPVFVVPVSKGNAHGKSYVSCNRSIQLRLETEISL